MIHIKLNKVNRLCCQCKNIATVEINDMRFCPKCGDDILLKTIVKITKALQQVTVKIQLTANISKGENDE